MLTPRPDHVRCGPAARRCRISRGGARCRRLSISMPTRSRIDSSSAPILISGPWSRRLLGSDSPGRSTAPRSQPERCWASRSCRRGPHSRRTAGSARGSGRFAGPDGGLTHLFPTPEGRSARCGSRPRSGMPGVARVRAVLGLVASALADWGRRPRSGSGASVDVRGADCDPRCRAVDSPRTSRCAGLGDPDVFLADRPRRASRVAHALGCWRSPTDARGRTALGVVATVAVEYAVMHLWASLPPRPRPRTPRSEGS